MQFIDEIKADVVYFKYTKFSAWSSTDRKGENGKMINASNTNLFNRYSNLACNSYYGIPIEPENLFEQGHEQDHCEAFIRTHFEKGCSDNFKDWEKQINDLPKWMDVKLTEPERNCIEIQLPSQGHPKSATVV